MGVGSEIEIDAMLRGKTVQAITELSPENRRLSLNELRNVETMEPDASWLRLFSFDGAPQQPQDFDYAHWWCETHLDSVFRLFS